MSNSIQFNIFGCFWSSLLDVGLDKWLGSIERNFLTGFVMSLDQRDDAFVVGVIYFVIDATEAIFLHCYKQLAIRDPALPNALRQCFSRNHFTAHIAHLER